MTDAIEVRGVSKRFSDVRAVDAIDFTVPTGSLCGFLGPNGAGKSTTIRMIMSIIYPDSGSVRILGRTAIDAKDRYTCGHSRRVAFLSRELARNAGLSASVIERSSSWFILAMILPGRSSLCSRTSRSISSRKRRFMATGATRSFS